VVVATVAVDAVVVVAVASITRKDMAFRLGA
jgi:hypothetical protein